MPDQAAPPNAPTGFRFPLAVILLVGTVLSIYGVLAEVPCPAVDDAYYKSPSAEWIQSGRLAIPFVQGFLPQTDRIFACYPAAFQVVLAGWFYCFGVSLHSSLAFGFSVHLIHALLVATVARELLSRHASLARYRPRYVAWFAGLTGLVQLCNLAFFDRLEELALIYLWTGWLLTAGSARPSWLAKILLQGLCLGAAGLTSPWVGVMGSVLVLFRAISGVFSPSSAQTRVQRILIAFGLRDALAIGSVSLAMALVWYNSTEAAFPGSIEDQFLGTMRHLGATQVRSDWLSQLGRLGSSFLYSPGQAPATALLLVSLLVVALRGRDQRRSIPSEVWSLLGTGIGGILVVAILRPEAYTYLGAMQMLLLPCLGVSLIEYVHESREAGSRYREQRPYRIELVRVVIVACLVFAANNVVVTAWFNATLRPEERADSVAQRLREWIPESDRVAGTARHWHVFQGRNDWREVFFSSLESHQEVLACQWLVLPKDCGRPAFIDQFELIESVRSRAPSHHTFAYDLFRRKAVKRVESANQDVSSPPIEYGR